MINFENYYGVAGNPEDMKLAVSFEGFEPDYTYSNLDLQHETGVDHVKLSVASMLDTPLSDLIDNKRMTNALSGYGINNVCDFIEPGLDLTRLPGIGYGTTDRIDDMLRHRYGFDSGEDPMRLYELDGARDDEIAARHIYVGPNELLDIDLEGRMGSFIDPEVLDGLTLDDFLKADLDSIEELVTENIAIENRTAVAQMIIEEVIRAKDGFDDHRKRQAEFEVEQEAELRAYHESLEEKAVQEHHFDELDY